MKGEVSQISPLLGVVTTLPQPPEGASQLQNWTRDPETGGWDSRIGYEPYWPGRLSGYAPFGSVGRVEGLHVASSGTRHTIYFESNGTLYMLYEQGGLTGGAPILKVIRANRTPTSPNEAGPQFTDLGGGLCVVTNGHDRPLILGGGWPYGLTSEVDTLLLGVTERPLGFPSVPPPPAPLRVVPVDSPVTGASTATDIPPDAASVFWPVDPGAFAKSGAHGLGEHKATRESEYRYRISFLSDNGSESPLSELSMAAEWNIPATYGGFRYVVGLRIPVGPFGTAARRIYRTRNISPDGGAFGDTTVYLIDQIENNTETIYWDYRRLSTVTAPAVVDSSPFPCPNARFSALFAGRLFLDGGVSEPFRIYYSAQGFLDQFPTYGYIDLDGRNGPVQGLVQASRMLLVLRAKGIDAVTLRQDGGLDVSSISALVECRGPQVAVTPMGIMLVARDGIYLISGGLEGGAQMEVVNLTASIPKVISRWATGYLACAAACYNPKTREAHFYIPADGSSIPSLGMIFHLDTKSWSTRAGFPVGALAWHPSGYLIFGHNVGAKAITQSNPNPQRGLFVISARRALGTTGDGDVIVDASPPLSIYQSAWQTWGDVSIKKKVIYVLLLVPALGDVKVGVEWAKDNQENWTYAPTYRLQPPDAPDVPVWGKATWDNAKWGERGLIAVKYAVAIESCSSFAWRIQTSSDVILVGYSLSTTANGTRVIEGKL